MIRTLIIEDETIIRESIVTMFSKNPQINIVGDCGTVAEATILAKNCKPDLILSDINLTDGTAFDFLNQIKERNFNIIFITAHEEYALKAIKIGALDYLLKPIDEDELNNVIDKLITNESKNQINQRIEVVNSEIKGKNEEIVLRLFDSYQIIRYNELMYCKSDSGYTTFFLKDGRNFLVSKSLKEYESILPKNNFFRTHQSYLINLNFIDRFEKGGSVFLKNEIEIPVAVRKKEALLKKILQKP